MVPKRLVEKVNEQQNKLSALRCKVTNDVACCESKGKVFWSCSSSMGWASRSESPSKSESRGTNDFLRREDGVSAGVLAEMA